MASEKALYWMAVGLVTLVMGNHFAAKMSGTCLSYRSRAAVARFSAEGSRLLAMAQVALDRNATRFDRAEAATAATETHMAAMQATLVRTQAAYARVETRRAQMMLEQQVQQVRLPVICPRPEVHIAVPARVAVVNQDPI